MATRVGRFLAALLGRLGVRCRTMCVHTVTPSTPDEALAHLWAGHAQWREGEWIFRGEGDSRWKLMPSAYRDTALLYDAVRLTRGCRKHILAQIEAEWRTLKLFLAQVDRAGLPFATPDAALFDYGAYVDKYTPLMNRIKTGNIEEWPPSALLPNLALAQHYGVHTRLLDWTTSPQAAGYFACSKGAQLAASGPGFMTLWALRQDFLDHAANKSAAFARVVRVPRSGNPNLHAQEGLFVNYWPYGAHEKPEDPFVPVPFDGAVKQAWQHLVPGDTGCELQAYDPPLVRIEIPWAWAGSLLRTLAEMGFSPTRYFPGYVGAARAVQEQEFWKR